MKTSKLTRGLLTCILLCAASIGHAECSGGQIESWITTRDRSQLIARQASCIAFAAESHDSAVPIVVDEQQSFQPIDGY